MIQHTEEGREIISKFENLTAWDKGDILKYLVEHTMTEDEIEKYFIEGTGYVKYDDIDFAREVVENHQEDEVLDNMDDWEILDYLLRSFDSDANASNLADWMEKMYAEDVARALSRVGDKHIKEILECLYNNHSSKVVKMLKYYADKLEN